MYTTPFIRARVVNPRTAMTSRVFARFQFNQHLPCQVTLMIFENYYLLESIDWVFSRDLLINGISQLSGMADVQIWPNRGGNDVTHGQDVKDNITAEQNTSPLIRDEVCVNLTSSEGTCIITLDGPPVRQFIRHTLDIVPRDDENLTEFVDELLTLLFR